MLQRKRPPCTQQMLFEPFAFGAVIVKYLDGKVAVEKVHRLRVMGMQGAVLNRVYARRGIGVAPLSQFSSRPQHSILRLAPCATKVRWDGAGCLGDDGIALSAPFLLLNCLGGRKKKKRVDKIGVGVDVSCYGVTGCTIAAPKLVGSKQRLLARLSDGGSSAAANISA